jgi:hypothetical protein
MMVKRDYYEEMIDGMEKKSIATTQNSYLGWLLHTPLLASLSLSYDNPIPTFFRSLQSHCAVKTQEKEKKDEELQHWRISKAFIAAILWCTMHGSEMAFNV